MDLIQQGYATSTEIIKAEANSTSVASYPKQINFWGISIDFDTLILWI